jgi:hypothetical protein
MYTNDIQNAKLRQAELIREADNYRLIKSLRHSQTTSSKFARIIRSLATQLSLI